VSSHIVSIVSVARVLVIERIRVCFYICLSVDGSTNKFNKVVYLFVRCLMYEKVVPPMNMIAFFICIFYKLVVPLILYK
jgi:hypothetical protein